MEKDYESDVDIGEKMRSAFDFIFENIKTGSVFVHCEHGRTRSATTVAYFLMKYLQSDLSTVKDFLFIRRDCIKFKDFEEKLSDFYEKEEKAEDFHLRLIKKLSTFVAFWFFNQASTKEEFEDLERRIEAGEL